MKNKRLAPSMMCIFFNICSFFILALPAWYFSDSTIIKGNNDSTSTQSKTFLKLFEYNKLKEFNSNYTIHGSNLNFIYIDIFNILIAISLLLSLALIIILFIEVLKKSPGDGKLPKVAKIISFITLGLTLSALTIALLFSSASKFTVIDNEQINRTLSFNLSTGIYLFLIFNIASASCGIISPILKEYN